MNINWMKMKLLAAALLAAGLVAPPAAGAPRADIIGLGTLGGSYSSASGINDSGQVVGDAWIPSNATIHAFLYSGGVMQDLGTLDNSYSYYSYSSANGINASGQVVGSSETIGGAPAHAFLYSGGVMQDLGTLGGSYSSANGINASGQVVGYATTTGDAATHAFLYSGGVMQDLGTLGGSYSSASGINASGQVVGQATTTGNAALHVFLYSGGVMQDIGTLGGGSSYVHGINASGQVVGNAATTGNIAAHAFLYSGGVMQDLGTLGGSSSSASGINDSGQVVGNAGTTDNIATHPFLWNAGTMFDLQSLAPAGWGFGRVRGINGYAQIAGDGGHNGVSEAYLLTLHPDWQGGNGSWDDASRWNFTGFGAFGITPGAPHDVAINPAGSATVYGPTDATVRTLAVSAGGGQLATLNLNGGSIYASGGATLGANGTLAGSGRLAGNLAIQSGGQVYVKDYESMQLAGNVSNSGRIDVQSRTSPGNLEVGGAMTNAPGSNVNLMNANLFVHGGMTNGGRVSIAGLTTVSGAIDNQAGGQVNISGVAAEATFWDNFRNNGSVNVTGGSTATFFGLVNGAGSFLGAGTKEFAGGYAPGNSPALVSMGGNVVFMGGTLSMELGGTTPGSGHDKIVFLGPVTLASGVNLGVEWWNGWTASAGDVYDLFDWDGGLNGTFGQVMLPTLASGLVWNSNGLYTTGSLSVAAVPEPETWALMLAGMGLIGWRRSRSI